MLSEAFLNKTKKKQSQTLMSLTHFQKLQIKLKANIKLKNNLLSLLYIVKSTKYKNNKIIKFIKNEKLYVYVIAQCPHVCINIRC